MSAATYEVITTHLKTGAVRDVLPVTGITYTETLNAPGGMSCGIPLNAPEATPERLFPAGTGLVVLRDGEPVWGGILWTLAADLEAGTLTLNASGYHAHFQARHWMGGERRTGWDQGALLRRWLDVFGVSGITVDTSQIPDTGHTRSVRWTRYEGKAVGEAIEELADDPDGFNFRYVPYWVRERVTAGIRFLISPLGGSPVPHSLTHRVNCNVTRVSYDVAAMATSVYAFGANNGAGETLLGAAHNNPLEDVIPRKNIVLSHPDVKTTQTLLNRAAAALTAGSEPVAIPALTLYPDTFAPAEFVPGDTVYVSVDSGYVALQDDFVITERRVDIDTNGRETISLSLANKELFNIAN